jgi:cell division protein FtsW
MRFFQRTDKSLLGQWWWTVDKPMLIMFLILMASGVLLVAAASPPVAERIGLTHYHFLVRHMIVLVPALIALFGFSLMDLKTLRRASFLVFCGGIGAMILVLFIGMEIKGAQRWLHLPGFSLQPSEFVKPAFLVLTAWVISRQKENPNFPGMRFALMLYALTLTLLILQPDMGMSFVVTCCFLGMIFLAGLPLRWVVVLGGLASGAASLAYITLPHVKSRVDRFLDPENSDTFQVDRSLEAFHNGGLFGTGPGQGSVKMRIPDAHADFIFSVAAEEMGFIALLVLIGLFAYIILRGFNRIMDSDDLFVVLATGALLCMFGLQALVHMGSAMSLLPTKGMTLPFISYGGSSLLSMGMAMGMVLCLTRRQKRSGIARKGLSIRPVKPAKER